ncbi:MAG: phosphoribosylanthranilate isomerase [Microcoleaceae cyanobacterium]
MRVKICGITQLEQAQAIAQLGATALGFICVPSSPRYISPKHIQEIVSQLPAPIDCIGVFVNTSLPQIVQTVAIGRLTGVQLHGDETVEFCNSLRQVLPQAPSNSTPVELIKAIRVQSLADLERAQSYLGYIDTVLLDAYHPQQFGGTGKTLNWQDLPSFHPGCSWFLAGGLTPENISSALRWVHPDGIDLSSGVETSPGVKNLAKVAQLFEVLARES